MKIEASGIPSAALVEYARIPIAFEVSAVLDVTADRTGGFVLEERAIDEPYLKDYDAIAPGPAAWAQRFDTSRWEILVARVGDQCVGGAAVAFDSPGLDMFEGRSDLAVLWDIRVRPDRRREGIGAALVEAVEAWAIGKGCRAIKVETQNINVAACRFYARQGFVLHGVHPGAYPECPDEIQLLWYKQCGE